MLFATKSSSYAWGLIGITCTYLFYTKSHRGSDIARPLNNSDNEFYALINDAFSLLLIGISDYLNLLPPTST